MPKSNIEDVIDIDLLAETDELPNLDHLKSTAPARRPNSGDSAVGRLQQRLSELVDLANVMNEQLAEISETVSQLVDGNGRSSKNRSTARKKSEQIGKRRADAG